MTLDLRIAARPEPLLDALAGWLEVVPADPFTFDLVVVPNAGMREWAAAQLVDRLGVLSNVEFVFPAELARRTLGLPDPADDPWRPERLAWHVLALMAQGADLGATPWEGVPPRPWTVARRVADLLERYASQRPDLIGGWLAADPREADDPARAWQQATWRALRARVGAPSSAEHLLEVLDGPGGPGAPGGPGGGEGGAPGLPPRLAVLGVSSLAAPGAAVLVQAARSSDVLVLATAAAAATLRHELEARGVRDGQGLRDGDGASGGSAADARALLVAPERPRDLEPATHPLLLTWGRPALEAATMLARLPVVPTLLDAPEVAHGAKGAQGGHAAVPTDDGPRTQLAALQAAVHAGVTSAPSRLDRERDGDGSVQVHACHGLVRQLEVLRDAILHAMAADPTLLPRDVAVLCADLEAVAPLAVPVLGADVGGRSLPVLVTDRAATTAPPVQAALDAALALTTSRLERDEVLTFLSLPVVTAALGLEPDDLVMLERTADVLDVRWGHDGAHRGRWGYPRDVTVGTWREALDRLLAGLLLDPDGEADDALVGGIAPAVGVGTQEIGRIGRLADALAAVEHLSRFAAASLPMSEWAAPLRWLVDTLLRPLRAVDAASHAFAAQAADVRRLVDELVDDARRAGVEHPIDVREVRAAIADRTSSGGSRARLRTGHVSVASLTPLRGVPFRLVAVVGVGDGLVSSARGDDDDVLALAPRLGERDAADERRAALLDAVLAARGTLIVTCDGQDVRTGATLDLPTVVEELLDALPAPARVATDTDTGTGEDAGAAGSGAPLVVRHPRHLADRRNLTLGPGALPRVDGSVPWTFSPSALRTLEAFEAVNTDAAPGVGVLTQVVDGAAGTEDAPHWQGRLLPPAPSRSRDAAVAGGLVQLRLDDVIEALRRPSRVLLRERLGVRLPGELASAPRPIELWVEDTLARWRLSEELLAHLVAGGTADGWLAARPAYGGLPPGPVGRDLLASFVDEVTELHELAGRPVAEAPGRGRLSSLPISVELDVVSAALGTQRVRIVGTAAHLDGVLVDVSATKDHPSHVVDAAVRLLAASVQGAREGAATVTGARVVRAAASTKVGPGVHELAVRGGTAEERARHAADALARLVDLALRVRTGPAPLLPRTAWSLGTEGGRDLDVSRPPTGDLAADVGRDLNDPAVRVVLGVTTLPELARQVDGPLEQGLPDAPTPVQRWSAALVGAVTDAIGQPVGGLGADGADGAHDVDDEGGAR